MIDTMSWCGLAECCVQFGVSHCTKDIRVSPGEGKEIEVVKILKVKTYE